MFIFLLSGLFCCLGFSGVVFFAVWAGACLFCCCLGGGRVFVFCCLGGGRVFFFLLFGRGRVLFFAVWAGACFFFAVWAGGVFFFAVWAGDGSSLTYPSAWLIFKRPNNKRDRTAKKNTGSIFLPYSWGSLFGVPIEVPLNKVHL